MGLSSGREAPSTTIEDLPVGWGHWIPKPIEKTVSCCNPMWIGRPSGHIADSGETIEPPETGSYLCFQLSAKLFPKQKLLTIS